MKVVGSHGILVMLEGLNILEVGYTWFLMSKTLLKYHEASWFQSNHGEFPWGLVQMERCLIIGVFGGRRCATVPRIYRSLHM